MKSAIVRNVFERQIQGIMPTHQKNVRADSNTRGWTNVRCMSAQRYGPRRLK